MKSLTYSKLFLPNQGENVKVTVPANYANNSMPFVISGKVVCCNRYTSHGETDARIVIEYHDRPGMIEVRESWLSK